MDFLDAYSYGYDQVSVNPVRFVNYDDTDFRLFQNKMRDPSTANLQTWVSSGAPKVQNPYADRGPVQRNEMQYTRTNLEDVIDPYGASVRGKDQVLDQISVPSRGLEEIRDLERDLARMKRAREESSACRKCGGEPKSDVNYLLILLVIMTAICLFQHTSAYTMNTTLLDILKNQRDRVQRVTPSSSK